MVRNLSIFVVSAICSLASGVALAGDPADHHIDGGTAQPDNGTGPGHGGPSVPSDGSGHGGIDNPSYPGSGGGTDPDGHGGSDDIDDPSFPGGDGGNGGDWGI